MYGILGNWGDTREKKNMLLMETCCVSIREDILHPDQAEKVFSEILVDLYW